MGLLNRIGFALSAAVATCAGGPAPDTDVERVERIREMYARYRTEFPDVPTITAEALIAAQAEGQPLVVVDTRTEAERAVSVIPGAIPAAQVEADPQAYRGKELVAYCTIGYRSGLWAERMHDKQGLQVRNLEGSLLLWTHAGGPLRTAAGEPTQELHVYGKPWNLARKDYTAVW